ncbi:hypothetical protein [Brucella anthropi]|nr:hypothetical protein [Brucella anthropi]
MRRFVLDARQAGIVKLPHGLLVDHAGFKQALHSLMDSRQRLTLCMP